MDKKLYLLDEIESSLDVTSRLILADIIKQFQKQ
jgi:ABC-type multidrug transport system ATPase subunit